MIYLKENLHTIRLRTSHIQARVDHLRDMAAAVLKPLIDSAVHLFPEQNKSCVLDGVESHRAHAQTGISLTKDSAFFCLSVISFRKSRTAWRDHCGG